MLQYNSQYTQSFSSVFYVIIYKNKKLYCFFYLFFNTASCARSLQRNLPVSFFQRIDFKQSSLLFAREPCIANVVLIHKSADGIHTVLNRPRAGYIVAEKFFGIYGISFIVVLQSFYEIHLIMSDLYIVCIADNNIEVSILCVMQIVHLTALEHIVALPEGVNQSRFNIDYFGFRLRVQLLQYMRNGLCRLLSFGELP